MWRAGHPRVTHPFAARVPRRALPLDLHVLSTPPAFVLSQDQTLQQKTLEQTVPAKKPPTPLANKGQVHPKKPHDTTTTTAAASTRTNTPNIGTLLSSQRTTTPPYPTRSLSRPSGGRPSRPSCPRGTGTTPD